VNTEVTNLIEQIEEIRRLFDEKIFYTKTNDLLFNQWSEHDSRFDVDNSDAIRRQNFLNYLNMFTKKPVAIVCGEAPGPHGCRRTGIPFTDEVQITHRRFPFKGRKTSKQSSYEREISGKFFWSLLAPVRMDFFVYNCVPYHPFLENKPLSIRTPTDEERKEYAPYLEKLVEIIQPKYKIAIGRSAEKSFRMLGFNDVIYVRHPAHGGAPKFIEGMTKIFHLEKYQIRVRKL